MCCTFSNIDNTYNSSHIKIINLANITLFKSLDYSECDTMLRSPRLVTSTRFLVSFAGPGSVPILAYWIMLGIFWSRFRAEWGGIWNKSGFLELNSQIQIRIISEENISNVHNIRHIIRNIMSSPEQWDISNIHQSRCYTNNKGDCWESLDILWYSIMRSCFSRILVSKT